MNTVARIAFVASLAFSAYAFAQEPVASENGTVRVAALQLDAARPDSPQAPVALDQLVGRYELGDGRVFIVLHEDGALTIELPKAFAVPTQRLEAIAAREFASADSSVRVEFDVNAAGRVTGAVLRVATDTVAARRAPLPHGIVTIQDVVTDAAQANAAF